MSGSGYEAITGSVRGEFSAASGSNCDTKCALKFGSGTLENGGMLSVQGRITASDWSSFNLGNDYSAGNADHLYILKGGSAIFGTKP